MLVCKRLSIQGFNLTAVYNSSEISTTSITVLWNHPYQDADLVQSYNVSLREIYNSYNYKTSVELQTNYTFESSFTPSFLYLFEVFSNVFLSDPDETIIVKTNTIYLVVGKQFVTVLYSMILQIMIMCLKMYPLWVFKCYVKKHFFFKKCFQLAPILIINNFSFKIEPQPPGPIDTNSSNFHPQMLYLKWEKSENSTYVNRYRVTIYGYSLYTSSNTISWGWWWWWLGLEPGRNYTVQIEAICWHYSSYSKSSPAYTEEIQTLRKLCVKPQLPYMNV